jgi:hypothetical protein
VAGDFGHCEGLIGAGLPAKGLPVMQHGGQRQAGSGGLITVSVLEVFGKQVVDGGVHAALRSTLDRRSLATGIVCLRRCSMRLN